jgi:uncharacterized NAD(P)/FAD-binding protein YdhS
MRADLAIVGMGLSGTRALIELVARLADRPPRARPLEVAIFDRAGEFGRGIPYGSRSDRRAMLIEDLQNTRCPEFARWVHENPAVLDGLAASDDADDRAWYVRHAAAVATRAFDGLHLPRHVFGEFSAGGLAGALALAQARSLLRVTWHVDEVLDVSPVEDGYELETAGGVRMFGRQVLLAVGSIPRADAYRAVLPASVEHRYLCDAEFCGSFALRAAFDRYVRQSPSGGVRLAIIGAAASGLESLYCAMHHELLSARIDSVTTLSCSGMLPGGLRGTDAGPISDYARLRTSAADYVRTARDLLDAGRLHILAARVQSLRADSGELFIDAVRPVDGAPLTVSADLVINSSGAGRVHSTTSRLLRNLGRKLTSRREGRGFAVRDDHSLVEWPGVLLAGPLLNGGTADGDVESISAVFRVGRELGATLARAFEEPVSAPSCSGISPANVPTVPSG